MIFFSKKGNHGGIAPTFIAFVGAIPCGCPISKKIVIYKGKIIAKEI